MVRQRKPSSDAASTYFGGGSVSTFSKAHGITMIQHTSIRGRRNHQPILKKSRTGIKPISRKGGHSVASSIPSGKSWYQMSERAKASLYGEDYTSSVQEVDGNSKINKNILEKGSNQTYHGNHRNPSRGHENEVEKESLSEENNQKMESEDFDDSNYLPDKISSKSDCSQAYVVVIPSNSYTIPKYVCDNLEEDPKRYQRYFEEATSRSLESQTDHLLSNAEGRNDESGLRTIDECHDESFDDEDLSEVTEKEADAMEEEPVTEFETSLAKRLGKMNIERSTSLETHDHSDIRSFDETTNLETAQVLDNRKKIVSSSSLIDDTSSSKSEDSKEVIFATERACQLKTDQVPSFSQENRLLRCTDTNIPDVTCNIGSYFSIDYMCSLLQKENKEGKDETIAIEHSSQVESLKIGDLSKLPPMKANSVEEPQSPQNDSCATDDTEPGNDESVYLENNASSLICESIVFSKSLSQEESSSGEEMVKGGTEEPAESCKIRNNQKETNNEVLVHTPPLIRNVSIGSALSTIEGKNISENEKQLVKDEHSSDKNLKGKFGSIKKSFFRKRFILSGKSPQTKKSSSRCNSFVTRGNDESVSSFFSGSQSVSLVKRSSDFQEADYFTNQPFLSNDPQLSLVSSVNDQSTSNSSFHTKNKTCFSRTADMKADEGSNSSTVWHSFDESEMCDESRASVFVHEKRKNCFSESNDNLFDFTPKPNFRTKSLASFDSSI